mgnify:CR=1 FL=1
MPTPDDPMMSDGEDFVFSASSSTSAGCTLESMRKTMDELRKRFPDPPIKRIRVTQWLYDALKARAAAFPSEAPAEPADWPFDAMALHGVPVVVDLPGDHRPGYVVERAGADAFRPVYHASPGPGISIKGLYGDTWLGIPRTILAQEPHRVTATEIGMRREEEWHMEALRKQMDEWQRQATIDATKVPIDDIEPELRRRYMRALYRHPVYRNASRREKTSMRRQLLALRVARF